MTKQNHRVVGQIGYRIYVVQTPYFIDEEMQMGSEKFRLFDQDLSAH